MENRYKLKSDAMVHHLDGVTKITLGTLCVDIEDENMHYFFILEKRIWYKNDLEISLWDMLVEYNLIIREYNNYYIDTRFEKNIILFESLMEFSYIKTPIDIQENIFNKRILLLGVGGVVLDNLLRIGVRNFIVLNCDYVDCTNLNRQLFFSEADIGIKKVDVVKYKNKDVNIISKDVYLNTVEQLDDICIEYRPDFIVNALDTPYNIEEIVFNVSRLFNIPSISCGVGINSGFWGPIYPNSELHHIGHRISNAVVSGSVSTTNMIIASIMCNDILLYWVNPNNNLFKRKIINFHSNYCEVI